VGLGELRLKSRFLMGNALLINAEMSPAEARALLSDLRAQYVLSLNERWYDDIYRYVPKDKRHEAIRLHTPVMAAQIRLISAIASSLKAVK
jgi:hypothetical protein